MSADALARPTIATPGAHWAVAATLDDYLRANPAARGTLALIPEQ